MTPSRRQTFARILVILVLLGLPAMAPAATRADTSLLDGRSFEVEIQEKGSDDVIRNTSASHSETFLSADCVQPDLSTVDL